MYTVDFSRNTSHEFATKSSSNIAKDFVKMDQKQTAFISPNSANGPITQDVMAEKGWSAGSALEAFSTLNQLKDRNANEGKKASRAFSAVTENSAIISTLRNRLSRVITDDDQAKSFTDQPRKKSNKKGGSVYSRTAVNGSNPYHIETPSYTFTLPNLNDFDENFRAFLEKDLIETASLKALEGSGHLNWWAIGGTCKKLWPLATTGDGNCLLHAASLGMWGFHDRLLMLRGALHLILTKGSRRHALWRRWRWQQTHQNKQAGLIYSEDEWRAEWENIVRLASPQPRSKPNSVEPLSDPDEALSTPLPNETVASLEDGSDIVYESLEELHVFALAHVLKRPIIVIADTVLRDAGGEAFAPIPFGGIYLPLECSPAECHRSPLVLCYDAAHFSALVIMQDQQQKGDKELPAIVPITDKEHRLLPLHFASDPGPDFTWWADEEDKKIAAAATLDDTARLDLLARYVGICKLPSKKKSAVLNSCFVPSNETTGRFGSHDGTFAHNSDNRPLISVPRQVMGSTGTLETSRRSVQKVNSAPSPKILWSRFTNTIRRRLKSKSRSFGKEKLFEKNDFIPNGESMLISHRRCQLSGERVSLADLVDPSIIVGAKLYTDMNQPFMQEMVENYLKSAQERFNSDKAKTDQPGRSNRRERISRSFSASNVAFRCMNGECTGQASHQTNYLCEHCFRKQKLLMESFTVTGNNIAGTTTASSSTAPNIPSTFVVAPAASTSKNIIIPVRVGKFGATPSSCASIDGKSAMPDSLQVSSTRCTLKNWTSSSSGVRRSTMGRSVSPVYTVARSKFYSMNGGNAECDNHGVPEVTVVQTVANGEVNSSDSFGGYVNGRAKGGGCRAVETRYGVTAVTNPHGVTHYFVPSTTSPPLSSSSDSTLTASACASKEYKVTDGPIHSFSSPLGGTLSSNGIATRL